MKQKKTFMQRIKVSTNNVSQLMDYIDSRCNNEPNFLTTPMGIFCRELAYKSYLEADAGSVGATLISGMADSLPCVDKELIEVDLDEEFYEAKYIFQKAEDYRLRRSFQKNLRDVLEGT